MVCQGEVDFCYIDTTNLTMERKQGHPWCKQGQKDKDWIPEGLSELSKVTQLTNSTKTAQCHLALFAITVAETRVKDF